MGEGWDVIERFDVSIAEWQARAAEWTDSRFPDDDLGDRGLKLAEEAGEVAGCIVKAREGRQDRDWMAELQGECVDVFFTLCAIAHRAEFDLASAIETAWPAIEAKPGRPLGKRIACPVKPCDHVYVIDPHDDASVNLGRHQFGHHLYDHHRWADERIHDAIQEAFYG